MSKAPSGNSGGAQANKVLGKPTPPKPSGSTGGAKATKVLGKTFTPGAIPSKSTALKPGAPVMGAQRMQQPTKAPQAVNAQRMNSTFKKLGF